MQGFVCKVFPVTIGRQSVQEVCTAIMDICKAEWGQGLHLQDVLINERIQCWYCFGFLGSPPIGAETDLQFQRSNGNREV